MEGRSEANQRTFACNLRVRLADLGVVVVAIPDLQIEWYSIIEIMNAADSSTTVSLYKRLGGYDVIALIVDEMFSLLKADPRFTRFAMGRSLDSHKRARQLLVDQLCALCGGPCFYIGRDMKTSHTGLKITDSEWNANLELTRQALEKIGIGHREQAEFLSMFERYKADILEA